MHKVKEVLRLRFEQNLSYRAISASCRISVGTVHDYLSRSKAAGLSWPLGSDVSDADLEQRLFPPPTDGASGLPDRLPDWSYVAKEVRRKGVTVALLWDEYIARRPDGIGYSQYCRLFREFRQTADPRMRQVHKAGDKLFVDYAGMTMPVVDRKSGEVHEAQIFVAAQGASNYTFAEATWTQSKPDWLGSHVRAFEFFGGVTRIVVPDNAKTGVTSPHFYEPDLNPSYLEMAEHYGIAIVPARPAKPRDKPKVETAVQIVERRILAPLRDRRFLSLGQLNEAMAALLDQLNNAPFQKLEGTRRKMFEEIDLPALRPLPDQRYVFADWKKARVNLDYHIEIDRHYYSVPFSLIKKEVNVRITARIIEVFYKGQRAASHMRLSRPGEYSTSPEHMPEAHQEYAAWTPEKFAHWAREIGGATATAVEQMLERHAIPEQGFRACMGVMRLGDKYGAERLEAACTRILAAGCPTYRRIHEILKKGMDAIPAPSGQPAPVIDHANIRGAAYYALARTDEPQTSLHLFETER
jgi:transposase